MHRFTPPHTLPVNVVFDDPVNPYELAAPVLYENGVSRITVPAGFRFDFASVPRWLWPVFPPVGRYARAALVHDCLYHTGAVERVQADAYFAAIMKLDGVPFLQRKAMHAAVRLFGWRPWNRRRAAQVTSPCLVEVREYTNPAGAEWVEVDQ